MIDGLTFVVSYVTYIIGTWSWASFIDKVCKGKAVPLQAWTDPEGSRKLRLPDYVT